MTTCFIPFRWLDVVDVLLVGFLIYQLYNIVKGTAAIRIFIGILAVYVCWKMVEVLQMALLTEILGQFISVGVIAMIIVFQQEIRRFLLLIGTTGFKNLPLAKRLFHWNLVEKKELNIKAITGACEAMAKTKTGALIVVSFKTDLSLHITKGEKIRALISKNLIESIFYKNSPLHDGAVIIKDNKIEYAKSILPLTQREDFPIHLGMRHRSAVGISENSDALAIIVSEQTGNIAFAYKGELTMSLSPLDLSKTLEKLSQK